MKIQYQIYGSDNATASVVFGDVEFLPTKGDRVEFNDKFYLVNEVVLKLEVNMDDIRLPPLTHKALVVLKTTEPLEPIGPGSITKKDFASLRGMIAHHGRCQFDLAHAGAQMPEDAALVRQDAEQARAAVFAALLKMEKGLGL